MRRILLTVLLTLVLAPWAWGQDCTWCDMPIESGKKVMWGRQAFCSTECRQEWYKDRFRCKICNERVEPKSNRTTYSDGTHVYVTIGGNSWDGYCEHCREGVKRGSIDPVKDRYVPPKKDDDLDPDADTEKDKDKVKVESQTANTDKAEDESSDYLTVALGLGVGAIFLAARMLR
jgi:hypothetical protein